MGILSVSVLLLVLTTISTSFDGGFDEYLNPRAHSNEQNVKNINNDQSPYSKEVNAVDAYIGGLMYKITKKYQKKFKHRKNYRGKPGIQMLQQIIEDKNIKGGGLIMKLGMEKPQQAIYSDHNYFNTSEFLRSKPTKTFNPLSQKEIDKVEKEMKRIFQKISKDMKPFKMRKVQKMYSKKGKKIPLSLDLGELLRGMATMGINISNNTFNVNIDSNNQFKPNVFYPDGHHYHFPPGHGPNDPPMNHYKK